MNMKYNHATFITDMSCTIQQFVFLSCFYVTNFHWRIWRIK